jgi:hypothetical protein
MADKTFDLQAIEADLLFSPMLVEKIQPLPSLSPNPSEILIRRDKDFEIEIELRGQLAPGEILRDREIRLGTVSEGESTVGKSAEGERIVRLNGIRSTGRPISTGDREFKDIGSVFRVTEEYQSGLSPHSVIMHLLGRPSGMFWGGSKRTSRNGEIQLCRSGYEELGKLKTIKFPHSGGHGEENRSDCFLVKSPHGVVLYSKGAGNELSRRFQPSYLHFISGKAIEEENARHDFLEAFSFAFGKRFVEIGHTELDESVAFIRRSSRSPYSYNLKREVLASELPPTAIHTDRFENDIDENKISNLVNLYLDAQTGMNLSEVMWRIWIARAMPLGQQLVSYAAALETLMGSWFSKPENESRTVYVAKAAFKDKTGDFLAELRKATFRTEDETADWKKIISQLESANRLSIADRFKHFMSSLQLQVGEVEMELWAARNLFAHGNDIRDIDAKRLVVLRRCYEALLNRCILRIIGFNGVYRDYSCMDFPARALETALAGPDGTGKI